MRFSGVAALMLTAIGGKGRERSNFVAASDPRIAYVGRFERQSDGAMRFAWPGCRIEARFTGSGLRMRLSDVPIGYGVYDTDRFTVRIDGGPPRVLHACEGMHAYTLAQGLGRGVHHVAIIKRTEAVVGTATLHGFELDKGQTLQPAPRLPPRHIELIGDSITAGYGNEGPHEHCDWQPAFENNDTSYGAFAARELGATYSAIAWSGTGLLRNFDPSQRDPIPVFYERVIPTDPCSALAPPDPRTTAVIVNVGTNDFALSIPDAREFEAAYRRFLARLRARYPDAVLYLAIGPMLSDDFPQPQARTILRGWLRAIRDRGRAEGDSALELIEFFGDPAEGLGCGAHPSVATHARLGRELAQALRARLEG